MNREVKKLVILNIIEQHNQVLSFLLFYLQRICMSGLTHKPFYWQVLQFKSTYWYDNHYDFNT